MTIPILFTFDDKLIMPAGVCITSLLENANPETFYDIFIIHSNRFDFSNTLLADFPKVYNNCQITFRPIQGEFVGGFEIRGIPETCYYRLISPEIITEYSKIIYSDVDVIFREDLSRFYEVDLGTNCFGGVDNCSIFRKGVRDYLNSVLKIDWRNGYYYSGNLIINLAQIRKEGLTAKFRELGKNSYSQQDMDIMNIACNGRFHPLGPSFCMTNFLYDLIVNEKEKMLTLFPEEELEHALRTGIVHYNGAKPWNGWCQNMDIWWEYYRRSFFYDDKFYFSFYKKKINEIEDWTLWKRLKHVARYFRK